MLSLRCRLNLIRHNGHFSSKDCPNLQFINQCDWFYFGVKWRRKGISLGLSSDLLLFPWALLLYNSDHQSSVRILGSIHLWIFRLEIKNISIWSYFSKFIMKSPMSKNKEWNVHKYTQNNNCPKILLLKNNLKQNFSFNYDTNEKRIYCFLFFWNKI